MSQPTTGSQGVMLLLKFWHFLTFTCWLAFKGSLGSDSPGLFMTSRAGERQPYCLQVRTPPIRPRVEPPCTPHLPFSFREHMAQPPILGLTLGPRGFAS